MFRSEYPSPSLCVPGDQTQTSLVCRGLLWPPVLAVPSALTAYPSPLPAIFNKDLLATLHLLVALAKRFQPNLPLPANVQVEVITMEVRAGQAGPHAS